MKIELRFEGYWCNFTRIAYSEKEADEIIKEEVEECLNGLIYKKVVEE